jgi:hypothetical protein
MNEDAPEKQIASSMILLDIISRWPTTETVFRRYDEAAGACLCCTCLFDTIEDIAGKYHLDLAGFMRDIEDAAAGKKPFV